MRGKVVAVTGAGSGIGAAACAAFAREGARVWALDKDGEAAARSAAACAGAARALDVTDGAAWGPALDAVIAGDGGLDVLVNGAGVSGAGPDADVAAVSLAAWRAVFAVNLEGALLGCQAALARLREGGVIVNIASVSAHAPTPTLAAYGASKAALAQLTLSVAAAAAQGGRRLRCVAVAPGMVDTAMTAGFAPAYRGAWEAQIPLARFARAEEVAEAIVFLASARAAYITGASLLVDGGLSARPVVDYARLAPRTG